MSLLSSLASLVGGRRGSIRPGRVSWPRPAVEELESRWVPAAPPVGVGAFDPGGVGGGFVPGTFSSGQTDLQTAALNPAVPTPGSGQLNSVGTLGGDVTQNGVVTNQALIAQSLILNRVPILAATQPVNAFGSITGNVLVSPSLLQAQQTGVSNANPLLLVRTARLSGSGSDLGGKLVNDSNLILQGMKDGNDRLPARQAIPGARPQAPPTPSPQSALPQPPQEQTQVAEESVQSRQRAPDPDQAPQVLDFVLQGGSLVELAEMLSHAGE